MKTYIFEQGRIDSENLNGKEIRDAEEKLGKLLMVVRGNQKIPVDYRENQIPVEEQMWFLRKQMAKKRSGK